MGSTVVHDEKGIRKTYNLDKTTRKEGFWHNVYIPYLSEYFGYLFSTVGYVIEGCIIVAKKSKKEEIVEETKVTDHVLVPKHEILSDEDKKQVLDAVQRNRRTISISCSASTRL